eukprot:6214467-Pleurochrysis_carterae.AAC.3
MYLPTRRRESPTGNIVAGDEEESAKTGQQGQARRGEQVARKMGEDSNDEGEGGAERMSTRQGGG